MENLYIGISPRFAIDDNANTRILKINMDYLNKLTDRGGIPLLLLNTSDLDSQLKKCSGFLILGGDDINPKYYGQTNELGLAKGIDDYTDEIDYKIIKYAYDNKVPTLGICRGIQVMASFLGGSLYQDIEQAKLLHPENEKKHMVSKITSTELTNLLPDSFLVNTFHHQCVNKLPEGFVTIFKNSDVIEGIQHKTLPIIGLQWHPERFYTDESKIIFDYYFKKVREFNEQNKSN